MGALAKITIGAISVRQELVLLGLTPEILANGITFGEAHRALCTDDDPRIFAGVTAWARTLRGLRWLLKSEGWTTDRAGNFETVVHPDRSLAISVTTGDKETGKYDSSLPYIHPKLKHPKGVMTQEAVDMNGWLFPEMAAAAKLQADAVKAAQERATWMLLIHRTGDAVYSELSLPSKFSAGQVTDWKHRIVLEPFDVEPQPKVQDGSEPGNDTGDAEVDVPVRRR